MAAHRIDKQAAPRNKQDKRRAILLLSLASLLATGCRTTHPARAANNAQWNAPTRHNPVIVDPSTPSLSPGTATRSHRPPAPAESGTERDLNAEVVLHGKPLSSETGLASWYGPPYHNHQAADGSIFDQNALTAAHRTLPLGTVVRVTNLATEESVLARITDRGPFVTGRTLDLSLAAAKAIGIYRAGVAMVRVEAFSNGKPEVAGRWCVQIGVFIDPADAIQLKNDLKTRYLTAKVIEFAGPTGHWVRINPAVADQRTAQAIADQIHLPDAESYLIRTN